MGRLFAGTPWDRPPRCERCGQLEGECACAPSVAAVVPRAPGSQTARIRLETRAKGKMVTVVGNLDPGGNDLVALAAQLKHHCGAGGTIKDGQIELQGDHRTTVETILSGAGYKTERS